MLQPGETKSAAAAAELLALLRPGRVEPQGGWTQCLPAVCGGGGWRFGLFTALYWVAGAGT